MIAFIDDQREVHGVEPICGILRIAPSHLPCPCRSACRSGADLAPSDDLHPRHTICGSISASTDAKLSAGHQFTSAEGLTLSPSVPAQEGQRGWLTAIRPQCPSGNRPSDLNRL